MTASKIYVNGKFLGAGLNGVHRTAAHFSDALLRQGGGQTEIELLAPRPFSPDPAFPRLVPRVVQGRLGPGQGWEMLTLPRAARDGLLVNFCNLAPLLHPRSVVMIHDVQTYLYPEDYTGRQAVAYRMLLPWIGRRAVRVLTVSDFSRKMLAKYGIAPEAKIDVVHNGTDHILDVAPDPSILARHGLTRGRYVMTLGSAKGYKNIRRVFDAMREPLAEELPLVVAGGPPATAYEARGWTPPAGTVFTGFVSDAELRSLYAGASLFAFPSLTEGFGLPPVEAMHCDTPVVAADAGAMPEVCTDGAILVDPADTRAWRAALQAICDQPDLSADLISKGKARAEQLTWASAGARVWSCLQPLL
ncbi:glycosyltransferase family 4 protein [Jannaschia aquimarina]|uniref:MshA_3 protein n=1 Tax=Jannaschia aquimarina TaxID=935700 RepID=A0A0D1CNL7_9RHOB|nr:glycosyltransferase family 1 protein [Jannaschia aquimarina]KIT16302.1 D-inositol 3-phosphate glycosyltransferase [Jannaschia aquimarina]SNT26582.1 Glycosyltransferase involved in cell wall bisynthesis [Jannaschia aquimarina]